MKIKITALDKAFSNYIRSRDDWKCQRCHHQYHPPTSGLHNSHFFGRARKSVRFDPENCDALCHGCHRYFTANPNDYREWKLKQLGQRKYDMLVLRANTPGRPDYAMIDLWLKNINKIPLDRQQ